MSSRLGNPDTTIVLLFGGYIIIYGHIVSPCSDYLCVTDPGVITESQNGLRL
jgi:hypothetical protein